MLRSIILILILALILVTLWFKDGYILGSSEDGLIFHNISRYFHQAQFTWMDYPGLGSPSLSLPAGKPIYFLLSFFQDLGIPGFIIQATVFWFILVSGGIGIFLLSRELFPKLPIKYTIFSFLFYWFNPISLAYLLNRDLLYYIFFFALLPLATFFYIKGLRKGKYFWSLALNAVLVFYSYAFSYIAFTILFWLWLSLVTFYYILLFEKKIFALKYFLLTLALFVISNCWWILPLVSLKTLGGVDPIANVVQTQQNSVGTLNALSKRIGNLNGIFKLINSSFLEQDSLNWMKLYYSPILFIIEYFIVCSILFFVIKFRKDRVVLFFGSLFLSSVFLAKGNTPPFGEIYEIIFKKFLILQVFRNPFEKFSFLLSLTASILVGPSIYELIGTLQNKLQLPSLLKKIIYIFVFPVIILYLGFPLYSSLVFTNKFPPTNDYSIGYKVKVPNYYKEVDEWLSSQGNNFRYIGLPIKDETVTYKWEKGYRGAELTVPLFSTSGILLTTSTPYFNQIVPEIEKSLFSDNGFSNFTNSLNAKYYLIRYDIDYKGWKMTDPAVLDSKLNEMQEKGEVKKAATFGKVSIWENLKWRDFKFYPAKKIIEVDNFDKADMLTSVNVSEGEVLIDKDGLKEFNQQLVSSDPAINYYKKNPAKYILHLKNVTKPFIMVFSELYNSGWKAQYMDRQAQLSHIRTNFYGNGWIIDQYGDFDVVVEFLPQQLLELGEKISVVAYLLTLAMGVLLVKSIRKTES